MKFKRKKKGSAFVTVIIVASILAITGTTMLTVTASDYKMRKIESEKVRNLYEADSGLNIVENIIIKASQSAIRKSDEKIKLNFSSLNEGEKTPEKINKSFEEEFYDYLNKILTIKKDGTYKEVKLLEYLIINKFYIDESQGDKLVYEPSELNSDVLIEIKDGDYKISEDGIEIKVQSTFKSKEGDLENKKTLQSTFKIVAPNYNAKISEIGIYPVFDNKAITVDGNMEVEGGSINILGDIWVEGDFSKQKSMEYAFDKYEGGILLNKTKLNLKGNAYTFNSFNLKDKVEDSQVDGYVYANNLYVGKSSRDIFSEDNEIVITKDLILNNDLALNSSNSNVTVLENFYGINDKTIDTQNAEKAMNSSSIIVNETLNTSSININKDSYIMGVAYLDATDEKGNKYQTGESVSIKGNYLAYTDSKDLDKGVTLKYYSPLQLLESIKGDSSLKIKADYFEDYYSENDNTYKLKQGGVYLNGDVYSVGASIKDNKATSGNLDGKVDEVKLVNKKQEDFALKVLAMGDSTGISDLDSLYGGNTVIKTVENQIDFSEIESLTEKRIINEGKALILVGNGETLTIEDNLLDGKLINRGLIITNGHIEIKGNFNFEGTIITSKNLYIMGSGTKNIYYNAEVVREILGNNKSVLEKIFKNKDINDKEINKIAEEIRIVTDTDIYDKSKFLKVTEWKIIK